MRWINSHRYSSICLAISASWSLGKGGFAAAGRGNSIHRGVRSEAMADSKRCLSLPRSRPRRPKAEAHPEFPSTLWLHLKRLSLFLPRYLATNLRDEPPNLEGSFQVLLLPLLRKVDLVLNNFCPERRPTWGTTLYKRESGRKNKPPHFSNLPF